MTVSVWDLVHLNLTSPAVLAFTLGAIAVAIGTDLRFSEQISAFLSSYLLFAIGFKGGICLREADINDLWRPTLIVVALGVAIPVIAYVVARRFVKLNISDAAGIAAHYGSVSAVTFTAAESFNRAAGKLDEEFLPALVALMEIPGIIVALIIASRLTTRAPIGTALREVISGKSIVLLVGGLLIGGVAAAETLSPVKPLFIDLFTGFLVLFLLDLGATAGRRFGDLRHYGFRLVVFSIGIPLVFGSLATLVGVVADMSTGGAAVIGAMAASASYIAAPAAVRVGIPQANLGVCLGASLAVTFPFNLVIGIPLYSEIAALVS